MLKLRTASKEYKRITISKFMLHNLQHHYIVVSDYWTRQDARLALPELRACSDSATWRS